MKPDKHKQKKAQQYKAKHGSTKVDKESKSTGRGGKLQPPTSNEIQGRAKPPANLHDSVARHSGESDDGEDYETRYRKKRVGNLGSNWERYEELPDDPEELITSRGAHISTLLHTSSGAVAQFRFVDELALEEDLGIVPQCHADLSLDSHSLAAALDCIPFHDRLTLEPDVFQEADLEKFTQDAKDKKRLLNQQSHKSASDSVIPQSGEHTQTSDLQLDSILDDITNSETCAETIVKHPEYVSKDLIEDLDDILSGNGAKISEVETPVVFVADGNSKKPTDSQTVFDGDIVTCMGQDKSETKDKDRHLNITKSPITTCTNIEDDLDGLLSLDDTSASSSNKISDVQNGSVTGNENLEDWLDSVLDA